MFFGFGKKVLPRFAEGVFDTSLDKYLKQRDEELLIPYMIRGLILCYLLLSKLLFSAIWIGTAVIQVMSPKVFHNS